jgi:hypothetical protein
MAARNRRKKIEPRLVCGFAVLTESLMLASIRGVLFGQKKQRLASERSCRAKFRPVVKTHYKRPSCSSSS